MKQGKRLLILASYLLFLCAVLSACNSNVSSPAPNLFLAKNFQWHQDSLSGQLHIAFPITGKDPGPTVNIVAQHKQGLGVLLSSSTIGQYEETTAQQTMNTIVSNMKKQGWQELFVPATTSTYPYYVLYVTFQSDTHYCFVEYSSTTLTSKQATQQIDIYYR